MKPTWIAFSLYCMVHVWHAEACPDVEKEGWIEIGAVEGTVVAYAWLSALQHTEEGTESPVLASGHRPVYFLLLNAPEMPLKKRKRLTDFAKTVSIHHKIVDRKLKPGEVLLVLKSERLKELKLGAKVRIGGYLLRDHDPDLFHDAFHETVDVDGKPTTPADPLFEKRQKEFKDVEQ